MMMEIQLKFNFLHFLGGKNLTVIEKVSSISKKKRFRILWISRHPILKSQENELKRLFGEVEIIWWNKSVINVGHVLDLMKYNKADEVVAVLPLSIIQYLVKEGVYPLFSEMEYVGDKNSDVPAEYIDERTGRKYRFKQFVRIKDIIIVKEPVEPIINKKEKTVEKDGMPF